MAAAVSEKSAAATGTPVDTPIAPTDKSTGAPTDKSTGTPTGASTGASTGAPTGTPKRISRREQRVLDKEAAEAAKAAAKTTQGSKPDPVSVSELKYWLEGDPSNNANNSKESGAYLSYTTFLLLSIFGGFLALDHLYLRSPGTFVAKFAVNLFCFGIWWLWDVCQAFFNESTIRIYGVGVPGFATKRIGAGMLAKEEGGKKHIRFFLYSIALVFGGLIGLDSFLVGEMEVGLFRLIATLTFIFLPVSAIEWVYKMYRFFFNTKEVVEEYSDYFGAIGGNTGRKSGLLRFLFGSTLEPVLDTIDGISGAVSAAANTATTALDTVGDVADTVTEVVKTAKNGFILNPAMGLYSGVTSTALKTPSIDTADVPNAAPGAKQQVGGKMSDKTSDKTSDNKETNIKLLPYTLVGTVLLIFASGIFKNFTNSKKDDAARDDSPPRP